MLCLCFADCSRCAGFRTYTLLALWDPRPGRMSGKSDNSSGHSKSRFWQFWTSLPGVMTAVTGLITAVVAVGWLGPQRDNSDKAASTGDKDTLAVDAWGDQVDEICLSVEREVRPLISRGAPTTTSEAVSYLQALTGAVDRFGTRVQDLPSPEGHSDERNALLGHLANLRGSFGDMTSALEVGDAERLNATQTFIDSETTELDKILSDLGATTCEAIDSPEPVS
jgi:hypothetical protein